MKELAKQYDPSQVEDRIYQFWLDGGYFHTKADPDKKPYTIVMPPPNVTGQLHMGHAVDNTMQDILHCYRSQGGGGYARRGPDQGDGRPRWFSGARMGMENQVRQPHRQPAEEAGQQLRLGARALYHGRGLL